MAVGFPIASPKKIFEKYFFENVVGIKNVTTFADPFAKAVAIGNKIPARIDFVL